MIKQEVVRSYAGGMEVSRRILERGTKQDGLCKAKLGQYANIEGFIDTSRNIVHGVQAIPARANRKQRLGGLDRGTFCKSMETNKARARRDFMRWQDVNRALWFGIDRSDRAGEEETNRQTENNMAQ